MTPATNFAWASALSSLGASVPLMLRQYNQDVELQRDRDKKNALNTEVQDILKGMPQYGSVLESVAGDMPPAQAQAVLENTSPEDKQAAADILAGKRGLDSMRLSLPASMPEPAMPQGGALGALMQPKPKAASRKEIIDAIRPIIRQMESGNRYGITHPRAKSGKQALGAYGIVPEYWFSAFPQFKLNASDPTHRKQFLDTPAIQDAFFDGIAEKGLEETGGDLRKFRAWYYGGPSAVKALDTDAGKKPEWAYDEKGQLIQMPSRSSDAEDFISRLDKSLLQSGLDASATQDTAPAELPWDNSLLEDLVKEKPSLKTLPKKVSYSDQERYLLSKVTRPEQIALLKDFIEPISRLAERERTEEKERLAGFENEQERYGENVRKVSQLRFDTWKEQGDRAHRSSTARDQSVQALRAQRDSMQKQLLDARDFQKRVASGKESVDMLSAAYPNFFSSQTKDPGFFAQLFQGDDAAPDKETVFDSKQFSDHILWLEDQIRTIDETLSTKSGASVSAPPQLQSPLSKYLKPRNQ